ncbi:hypothetical protein ACLOJK_016727 [Asimina triloba]
MASRVSSKKHRDSSQKIAPATWRASSNLLTLLVRRSTIFEAEKNWEIYTLISRGVSAQPASEPENPAKITAQESSVAAAPLLPYKEAREDGHWSLLELPVSL